MPTYQYACTDAECGHQFELVQSFTDPAADECPVCGHRVRKVYGSVGVVFKGSGFYRTDSRSDGKKPDGGSKDGKERKDGAQSKEKAQAGASGSGSASGSSETSGSSNGANKVAANA